MSCSVFGCSGKLPEGGLHKRFGLPKDKNLRLKWIHLCGRKDKVSEHGRICDHHFSAWYYSRDLKSEILGIPPPKI